MLPWGGAGRARADGGGGGLERGAPLPGDRVPQLRELDGLGGVRPHGRAGPWSYGARGVVPPPTCKPYNQLGTSVGSQ
jgi:hypothetical protein